MAEFKAERFKIALLDLDTSERKDVTVEVSLDGLKVLTSDERKTLRVYGLKNITRWELRDSTLTLHTKSNSDVDESQVKLSGSVRTCQLLLDTLTSYYYQSLQPMPDSSRRAVCRKTELMQGGTGGEFGADSDSLLSSNRARRKANVPAVDDVEFWVNPEKEGWLYSQGEVIKTWRRRWFVLKSGFLFRFLNNDLDANTKPRGIVDLSTVTDITEGSGTTGKQHSLKLSTATGHVCYCADSETDLVEWLSALDTAHTEIVKRVAGVDDSEDRSQRDSKSKRNRSRDMVSVVGYDTFATAPPASLRPDMSLNYGDIDGVSGIVETPQRPSPSPMVSVNYGPTSEMRQLSLYPNLATPPAYAPPSTYNGSILDQTPQQTPSYPSFQSIRAPDYHMQVPVTQQSPWQAYSTPDGRVYYHNRSTGETQWERPPELVM